MHFARQDCTNALLIRRYDSGGITIGEQTYSRSLILSRERLIDDWRPQQLDELSSPDLEIIRSLNPEVVLLGTGTRLQFPAPALSAPLLDTGIGVEIMDTAAACRTYNILLSEERQVVAALLIR